MQQHLLPVFQHFPLLHLQCTLRLESDARLPEFKGSLWHGWLGHQLKAHDSQLFHTLYVQQKQQQPMAYLIQCAPDYRTRYAKGSLLQFRLTLVGDACQLGERLVQALQAGPLKPLGKQQALIAWQSIASVLPRRTQPGVRTASLADWLTPISPSFYTEVALHLRTPLRIKQRGTLLKHQVPSLELLVKQIQQRFANVLRFWVNDDEALYEHIMTPVILGDYSAQGSHIFYENWRRFSAKQNEPLPFGGLMGQLSFAGDISPSVLWLQIGAQLGLGGKTTFGLGEYGLLF